MQEYKLSYDLFIEDGMNRDTQELVSKIEKSAEWVGFVDAFNKAHVPLPHQEEILDTDMDAQIHAKINEMISHECKESGWSSEPDHLCVTYSFE